MSRMLEKMGQFVVALICTILVYVMNLKLGFVGICANFYFTCLLHHWHGFTLLLEPFCSKKAILIVVNTNKRC